MTDLTLPISFARFASCNFGYKALVTMLVEARENAGITQTELAGLQKEYQSFVAHLESGQRRVDMVEFLRLSTVLNCDAHLVLTKLYSVSE